MKYKYVILLVSLIIQTCLGGIYAWSTFVPPLTENYTITVVQTQQIFGTVFAVFTVSMIFAGRMLNKYGPKLVACIGGLFFAAGYITASFSNGNFIQTFLGIGILGGIGIGMGYVCPLATCIKWFPKHKGLITGVSVASFGTGAIALSIIAEKFLAANMDVLIIFRGIGIIYGTLIVASAMFMAVPQLNTQVISPVNIKAVIKSRRFWLLFFALFSGTFSGMMVIGNLKPIGLSYNIKPIYAAMAISSFAIGNGTGRIIWGFILDRIGRAAIPLSLLALAGSVAALLAVNSINYAFIIAAFFIGFGFGACFVLYAAFIGIIYGPSAVASIYPWVFLAYGISGFLGPTVGGLLFEKTSSYNASIIVAAAVSTAGAIMIILGKKKQPADQSA